MRIRSETCPNCGAPLPLQGPCESCGSIVHSAARAADTCPGCGSPLNAAGECPACGSAVRGFYQGLNLGTVDIARAVEQGLDYYLLLGVSADASDATMQAAYRRERGRFPPDRMRLVPQMARRLELIEQAGYVLCSPQRRRTYDNLRRARLAGTAGPASEADRGLACFRAGQFDDAARLLHAAARHNPANEEVHLHYCLSLIYGSSNLASPEDWRVDEMIRACDAAVHASGSSLARAHLALAHAINHYDKNRFDQGRADLADLLRTLPDWHLLWIVDAYWYRREGDPGAALASAERARRQQPGDLLLSRLADLLRQTWRVAPTLLPDAARRAVQILGDGTAFSDMIATWR